MSLLNHHVRLRQRAAVFTCVCTGCGAVRDQPSRLVSFFLCLGRCRRYHAEGQQPPNPKEWTSRSRRTRLLPTSWAPVQRESRTVRPISLAFLGVQQTVGRQSTRATPVDRPAVSPCQPPHGASPRLIKRQRCWRVDLLAGGLKAASLNASAASESTS